MSEATHPASKRRRFRSITPERGQAGPKKSKQAPEDFAHSHPQTGTSATREFNAQAYDIPYLTPSTRRSNSDKLFEAGTAVQQARTQYEETVRQANTAVQDSWARVVAREREMAEIVEELKDGLGHPPSDPATTPSQTVEHRQRGQGYTAMTPSPSSAYPRTSPTLKSMSTAARPPTPSKPTPSAARRSGTSLLRWRKGV